jgi:uncharacterized protein YcaQ
VHGRVPRSISSAEARAVALAAQGLAPARHDASQWTAALTDVVRRISAIQIDSVNVLVRSHYLPAYSRLGAYDRDALDALATGNDAPCSNTGDTRRRCCRSSSSRCCAGAWTERAAAVGVWRGVAQFGREQQPFCAAVLGRDPNARTDRRLRAGQRRQATRRLVGLEPRQDCARVAVLDRRDHDAQPTAFRASLRPDRAHPARASDCKADSDNEDAQRDLLRISMRAMGIGTERDLRDYFRLPTADAKARIAELVEIGELQPVSVDGWKQPAFLDPSAKPARRA